MKNQHILLLSLMLLIYSPSCLVGKGPNKFNNNPKYSTYAEAAAAEIAKKPQAEPGSLDTRLSWWHGAHIRETLETFMKELTPELQFGTGINGENRRFTSAGLRSYKKNNQPDKMITLIDFLNQYKARPEMPVTDSELVTTEYREFISTHIKNIDLQLATLAPQLEQEKTLREKKAKISTILTAITVAEQK